MCRDCGCGEHDTPDELAEYAAELAEVETDSVDERFVPTDEREVDLGDDDYAPEELK